MAAAATAAAVATGVVSPRLAFSLEQRCSSSSRSIPFIPKHVLRLRRSSSLSTRRSPSAFAAAGDGEDRWVSAWDDKPFELLAGGRRAYLDEQDIAAFLEPPRELIPLDPSSYNPAAYLWKKIADVPDERRPSLLRTLKPHLSPKIWGLAGMRYEDVKLAKKAASSMLSMNDTSTTPEIWGCRASKGHLTFPWFNSFTKVLFRGKDGNFYGQLILGGFSLLGFGSPNGPLYFKVKQACEVMATEQPCDLAYEFEDELFDAENVLLDVFPEPATKFPAPFNDNFVIYIRHVGPGVAVGQAWQEGRELSQVPRKFCGEILMVRSQ